MNTRRAGTADGTEPENIRYERSDIRMGGRTQIVVAFLRKKRRCTHKFRQGRATWLDMMSKQKTAEGTNNAFRESVHAAFDISGCESKYFDITYSKR